MKKYYGFMWSLYRLLVVVITTIVYYFIHVSPSFECQHKQCSREMNEIHWFKGNWCWMHSPVGKCACVKDAVFVFSPALPHANNKHCQCSRTEWLGSAGLPVVWILPDPAHLQARKLTNPTDVADCVPKHPNRVPGAELHPVSRSGCRMEAIGHYLSALKPNCHNDVGK